jgi:Tfp pilus assembly protein PilF
MNLIKPFRIALVVLILLLGLPAAKAQQGGQGGGTGGTVSPPPKEGPKPPGVAPQQPTTSGESRKLQPVTAPVIFVTGRVVMDNGEPPPMGATIERDCGGLIKREATVDLAGNFGFQIGGDQRPGVMIPDASQGPMGDLFSVDESAWGSTSGPQGQGSSASFSRLLGCEFRAELSGYRSSTVRLDDLHVTGPVNAGTIVLFPIGRVRGTLVSATSMLAPKAAKKSLERARKAYRKKKFDEAETLLKSATEHYPKYAEAWFVLGRIYQQLGRPEDARSVFDKAIAADGLYVEPYVRLSQIAAVEKNWQEAADFSEKALALDPVTFPEAYFMNALANYNLNDLELAEKSARQAGRLDMQHRIPRIHLIVANILARRQDKEGAMAELRNYLKFAPKADDADAVRAQLEKMKSSP